MQLYPETEGEMAFKDDRMGGAILQFFTGRIVG